MKNKNQINSRVGFFIGKYDAGGSHTRDFIKSLAAQNICVDYFLCDPGGFKGVDNLSFNNDNINVYYLKRRRYQSGLSKSSILNNLKKIEYLSIYLYQFISDYFLKVLYLIDFKSENMIVPSWAQNETYKIIGDKIYNCFIGVEAMGLVYAGIMAEKYNTPYIYHSYELFSKEFPNVSGKQSLREFNLLKYFEKKYHVGADCTIIQDINRKEVLYKNNVIIDMPVPYMPISLMGEKIYNRGSYFHDLFNIDRSKKIILQYGSIYDERLSMEVAQIVNDLSNDFILVMHGRTTTDYVNRMKSLIKTGKLFISRHLVSADSISNLISSAYIGLSFYNTDDPNNALTNLSSHKLAHYTQCGLPIISNSSPTINKMIDKEGFGIYVDTISDIPTAISKIDANYKKYSEASYKAYSDYYSIDNYIDQIVELVQ